MALKSGVESKRLDALRRIHRMQNRLSPMKPSSGAESGRVRDDAWDSLTPQEDFP